ncbi:MAG: Fur-regulated basic protein FbpA [Bacillus sp. (in: Bacteria)]|nr:Fur-regulated basic protein FbpA [Bacillus sp. (in: firmicutes)]
MAIHLRRGLERLKQFYIKKLLESDHSDSSDHELQSLTIRELESLYKSESSISGGFLHPPLMVR